MTITASGYIVADDMAIWGTGDTEEAAWADMVANMAAANISVVEEIEYDHSGDPNPAQTLASEFHTNPASQELIDAVAARGGAIAWTSFKGVSCLESEVDYEHDHPERA